MLKSVSALPVITLTDEFQGLVVRGPGIDVEFHDGKITVRAGEIVGRPQESQEKTPPPETDPEIGCVFPANHAQAGLVYAGRTADGQQHIIVEPQDAKDDAGRRLTLTFSEAARYARGRGMEILPIDDMAVLAKRADLIGGFAKEKLYWSASEYNYGSAWIQRFSDGFQYNDYKDSAYYVRCARRCSVI